jgi:hypothetical protein
VVHVIYTGGKSWACFTASCPPNAVPWSSWPSSSWRPS